MQAREKESFRRVTALLKEKEKAAYLATAAGNLAIELGDTIASRQLNLSKPFVRYHRRKLELGIHQQVHGGPRKFKFKPEEKEVLKTALWHLVQTAPQNNLRCYANELNKMLEPDNLISKGDVMRIFWKWKWTWRICAKIQVQKFTILNMTRYANYVYWFSAQNWSKVKFVDEVHFSSKNVSQRKLVGPKNTKLVMLNKGPIDTRLTATVLTVPERNIQPLEIWIRDDTNTSYDFTKFILNSIESKALVSGDILVCDNASVHGGEDTFVILQTLFDLMGITIYFLPAYSPELNPVEMVFAFVKNYLRSNDHDDNLLLAIIEAFSRVQPDLLKKYYAHCANNARK